MEADVTPKPCAKCSIPTQLLPGCGLGKFISGNKTGYTKKFGKQNLQMIEYWNA